MADPIMNVNSRHFLKRVKGGRDGLYPLLESLTWDTIHWYDDFLADTLHGGYEVVTGVDGLAAVVVDSIGGVIEITPGVGSSADNEYCGFSLPELNFSGDRNAVFAARINLDAITTVKVEMGFVDVTTDAGAVNVLATPTFTADDFVGWVFDTDDTAFWQCVGVKATTAATKIEDGLAPVAATYETLVVALQDDTAKFYRLNTAGEVTYESARMSLAVTETVGLSPWLFVQNRAGSILRTLNVDFIDVRCRRTT